MTVFDLNTPEHLNCSTGDVESCISKACVRDRLGKEFDLKELKFVGQPFAMNTAKELMIAYWTTTHDRYVERANWPHFYTIEQTCLFQNSLKDNQDTHF